MTIGTMIKFLLTNEKARNTVIKVIAAIAFTTFIFFYAILASPWALLGSFFKTGGEEPDWNDTFATDSLEAYKKEYQDFSDKYISILQPPFAERLQEGANQAYSAAERQKNSASPRRDGSVTIQGLVYSPFTDMNSGSSTISPMDAGLILSMYNHVGLNWEKFVEEHGDVLTEMGVRMVEDPETQQMVPIGEIADVDMEKLLNLLERNKNDFFVVHSPLADGSCSQGAGCKFGHNAQNNFHQLSQGSVPHSLSDMKSNSSFQTPYFGVYYAEWTEEHEIEHENDDGTISTETVIRHCGDYTGVAYVEYRGFEFFQERLGIQEDTEDMDRVTEIFANLKDILGIVDDLTAGTSTAAALVNYEPIGDWRRFTTSWESPVNGHIGGRNITSWFNDPNYIAGATHWGIDMGGHIGGAEITPVTSGEVARIVNGLPWGPQYGFGNHVVIYMGKDGEGNKYFTIYAHMRSVNDSLWVGQSVTTSTIIGWVGNSGNTSSQSNGTHLHLELQIVHPDGTYSSVDPVNYGFDPSWFG